ncbi:hypothetical protein [Isoptericola sp. NPDC057191]|uniref:hypothetical protein n=1 Tax=Isoptericola sp. NPDC057191 TaxID=3346041 RepID=UPI003627B7F5
MTLPTPEYLGGAPLWENYVVAQLTQASLSLVPRDALALGVAVDGLDVAVVCQVRERTEDSGVDVDEIAQELQFLLGERVRVTTRFETQSAPTMTPHDTTVWVFAARAPEG